jgi:MurNAc alpha-1-phosphate uridylyltransferase
VGQKPDKAFILAAGKGTRLRPYTNDVPKPLVEVGGKTIIEHALKKLEVAGVNNVTINLHHLGHVIEHALKDIHEPNIHFSKEEKLLDTGGGIKKTLDLFGQDPFYIINGDALWLDGPLPALERLAKYWNPDKMDLLVLLQPLSQMTLTEGIGDYDLDHNGKATRSKDKTGAYMFTSIRICKPSLFENIDEESFSFLDILDKAETSGRLYGLVHDSEWHHISTGKDLERVNESFEVFKRYA